MNDVGTRQVARNPHIADLNFGEELVGAGQALVEVFESPLAGSAAPSFLVALRVARVSQAAFQSCLASAV
jgi:hypothetical protein